MRGTSTAISPDVVFTPMQTIGPWGRDYALVTTIHDLIYYTHRTPPKTIHAFARLVWRGYHLWWGFQRGLLNRADAHLADSETTKLMMDAHRATRNPVSVVHLGTDQPATPRPSAAHRPRASWSTWARSCPTRAWTCSRGRCTGSRATGSVS